MLLKIKAHTERWSRRKGVPVRASNHGSRKEETCRIAFPYGGQPALIRPLQRSCTPHDSFMCTQTGTNTHTTTTKLTSHHKDSQCSENIHLNRNRTEFFQSRISQCVSWQLKPKLSTKTRTLQVLVSFSHL